MAGRPATKFQAGMRAVITTVSSSADARPPMAVGVDLRGESYGLLIDQIGEVLRLPEQGREDNPVNLDPRMAKLAGGVHRLDGQLMVVLDVDRVLEMAPQMAQAA